MRIAGCWCTMSKYRLTFSLMLRSAKGRAARPLFHVDIHNSVMPMLIRLPHHRTLPPSNRMSTESRRSSSMGTDLPTLRSWAWTRIFEAKRTEREVEPSTALKPKRQKACCGTRQIGLHIGIRMSRGDTPLTETGEAITTVKIGDRSLNGSLTGCHSKMATLSVSTTGKNDYAPLSMKIISHWTAFPSNTSRLEPRDLAAHLS